MKALQELLPSANKQRYNRWPEEYKWGITVVTLVKFSM